MSLSSTGTVAIEFATRMAAQAMLVAPIDATGNFSIPEKIANTAFDMAEAFLRVDSERQRIPDNRSTLAGWTAGTNPAASGYKQITFDQGVVVNAYWDNAAVVWKQYLGGPPLDRGTTVYQYKNVP